MSRFNANKVIVAMSGGVDSSLAAALLKRDGREVVGAYLAMRSPCAAVPGVSEPAGIGPVCHAEDARRAAEGLGIEFHVVDAAGAFAPVVEYFLNEYVCGRTPNPCVRCNATVKFRMLMELADRLGAAHVATGHYARRVDLAGLPAIARARGRTKDQSYALCYLPAAWLGRILLPIGELSGKDETRRLAREFGLHVYDKPDSQEICFVADDDHAAMIRTCRPEAMTPGEIVDVTGAVVGRHDGYARYTVGQRRGLGVAMGVPYYVTHIDPTAARVTIGPREATLSRHLEAANANWHRAVAADFDAVVQIRYNHFGVPGRVHRMDDGRFEVTFAEPVTSVTPGQAAVVYDGDVLLGGGWIESGS